MLNLPTLIIWFVAFVFGYLIGKSVMENQRFTRAARQAGSILAGMSSVGIFIGILVLSEAVG